MKDLDALKNQLARDGRLQRLQEIADSTDGQKLAGVLDAQKIEQAARAGDTETLRQILTQVLSTDTGQRLAGKVKDAMQDG
ncbi:unknown [Firmicutes bacterium CAG:103]|nr:unknown [Firmicutes bacterium CAG:103]